MAWSFARTSPLILSLLAAVLMGGLASPLLVSADSFDGPQAGIESAGQTLIFLRLIGDPGAPVPGVWWGQWDGEQEARFYDETARFDEAGHWSYTWQVCDGCVGGLDSESIRLASCGTQHGAWIEGKEDNTYIRIALRVPTLDGFPSGEAMPGPDFPIFNISISLVGGTPFSELWPALLGWQNLDTGARAYWPDHDPFPFTFDAEGHLSLIAGYWAPLEPTVSEGDHDVLCGGAGEASYGIWRRRGSVLVREPFVEAIEGGTWGQIKVHFR